MYYLSRSSSRLATDVALQFDKLIDFIGVNPLYRRGGTFEPPHDKTNKMACAPSKDLDQFGHPPSLIKVFAVRMKKACVLSYPLSAQRRRIRLFILSVQFQANQILNIHFCMNHDTSRFQSRVWGSIGMQISRSMTKNSKSHKCPANPQTRLRICDKCLRFPIVGASGPWLPMSTKRRLWSAYAHVILFVFLRIGSKCEMSKTCVLRQTTDSKGFDQRQWNIPWI